MALHLLATYLDTHVLIWLYSGDVTLLSERAVESIEGDDLLVSPAVLPELQMLHEIKRIKCGCRTKVGIMSAAPKAMTIGELLKEEFLEPLELSQYRLAKDTGIPESTLSKIIDGRARITTELSIRLGRYFSCAPDYFARLQLGCEIYNLRSSVLTAKKEISPLAVAEDPASYTSA